MRTPLVLAAAALVLGITTAAARAEPAVALVHPNSLAVFDTASPAAVTFRDVTGLGANESVRGIDLRPSNGTLLATTVTAGSAANSILRTYTVDPATGAAALVGATAAALAGAADLPSGVDFHPVVSRVRYVTTNDENARLNPDNGTLSGNDTDLTPALTTDIIGAAYDRSVAGATATTLFAINRNGNQLSRIGGIDGTPSPNGGAVTNLGPLGIVLAAASDAGFDIAPGGVAYAAMTGSDDQTRLYTINLDTGAATQVGRVGFGGFEVRSLAILPPPPAPAPTPAPSSTPPPPPPLPVPDVVAPALLVAAQPFARVGPLARSRVAFEFSCSEACTVQAVLAVGRTTLARGTASLVSAGVAKLRLTTTRAQRRTIARLRTPGKATLRVTASDPTGNRRLAIRRVQLVR
jgi:Domain of unknown function (DUF4394)